MTQDATWLVANWKMHGLQAQVADYAFAISKGLETASSSLRCVFCPPFPFVAAAKLAVPGNSRLEFGAQNCHEQAQGAFTGEVSAAMVKDAGAAYVILGHSERRAAGETDERIAAKVRAASAAGLTPILCVGESEKEYDAGHTAAVLDSQLAGVRGLPGIIVAYEPVWAIGSGRTPKNAEIAVAHRQIKTALGSVRAVLYGGSVKPANLREILSEEAVDGVLIGGASLQANDMNAMIAIATERK
jgi:triosephosphate isomerase